MNRLVEINVLLPLLITALSGRIRGIARFCATSLYRINIRGTDGALLPCPSRPSGSVRGSMFSRAAGWAIAALVLITLLAPQAEAAATYGQVVNNQATLSYTIPSEGPGVNTLMDSASFTVDRISSMEVLQFNAASPLSYIINAGSYSTNAGATIFNSSWFVPPTYPPSATPVDITSPVPLEPLTALDIEDPIFLVVNDVAQNTNPSAVEYVTVTVTAGSAGETEIIRLVETGPDTGVFSSYIQTADAGAVGVLPYNGILGLTAGDTVNVSYTDSDSNTSGSSIIAAAVYGSLSVTKVSIGNKVAQGGFISYQVTVDETLGYDVLGVTVIDTLAAGFIYQPGSAMINSASSPAYVPLSDPTIGAGNVLTFAVGDMPGNESVNITYDVQVAPGTALGNVIDSVYATGNGGVVSNTTSSLVSVVLPALMEVLRFSTNPAAPVYDVLPGEYSNDGSTVNFDPNPSPAPTYAGPLGTVDITSGPVALEPLTMMHINDPIFLAVSDDVRNADPLAVEYVTITVSAGSGGESETIRLVETGNDTGVFTAYLQSVDALTLPAAPNDGYLSLAPDDSISISYVDDDGALSSSQILADPVSLVFDSRTGAPISGLTVTLVDALTSMPTLVNGDDGNSSFPNPVVTGGTYLDSSGKSYVFGPGQYRFPFIAAGDYSVLVTPTASYSFPSLVGDAAIQALPGAPYALSTASRGAQFTLVGANTINVDLPVDSSTGILFVTKTASKDSAAIGDYLQYRVTVDESSGNTVINASVYDKLPLGFVYMPGSAMINGVTAPDPTISADRRTLTFGIGDMTPGDRTEIKYVVGVASGTKKGPAVNAAYATGQFGEVSNVAEAVVKIHEDLFRSTATIMGRVVDDACGKDPEAKGEGVKGVRIYMENGAYVVTDENGMFHFEGVKPGGHVVQLDYDSLPQQFETVLCSDTTEQAGSSFSRFIDLQGGTLWRTDFHLSLKPRNKGELKVRFHSALSGNEKVKYTIPIQVEKVSVGNVRVTVILPEGIRYENGSSSINGQSIDDPEEMDGSLTFRLGSLKGNSNNTLEFIGDTLLEGQTGNYVAKMLVTFDTVTDRNVRMPLLDNVLERELDEKFSTTSFILSTEFEPLRSELSEKEIKELDKLSEGLKDIAVDHIFAFGYTDSLRLSKKAMEVYADNYELSRARAKTVALYVGEKLGLSEQKISFVGHGPDNPLGDNSTAEGRKKNRRVEIKVYYKKVDRKYQLSTKEGLSGSASMDIVGLRGEHAAEPELDMDSGGQRRMPVFDELWLRGRTEGFGIVWPEEGEYPSLPALTTAIAHEPGSEIALTLNGKAVNPVYNDGTRTDKAGTKAVTVFKAIPLTDGDNELVVRQIKDGVETGRATRNAHYSMSPVKATLVPGKSTLIADGKTSPVIAVRLTDADGYPARRGTKGEFSVSGPHKALEAETGTRDFMIDGHTRFTVANDGMAYIRLAPTAQTGEASLTIHTIEGDRDIKAWLSPDMREWILVGFAEGTMGHATLNGNAEALLENEYEEGTYTDGKVSFFAKGRIKGKWLLTMAYDSDKPSYNEYELHSIIDPDEYYTLYGDSTEQGYEAASARKLYLKIESERFYALFGDYTTGLTVTKLSRYSRSMNGFKADYNGDKYRYRVFASDTSHAFVKDEIPGDGTSGLYRLTRKNIVLNSDRIYIEVRDRFSPDVVLESRSLSRHIDYDIDYQEGTLFFREPVYSADSNFNPMFIVIDYESYDDSDTSLNYGGRGAVSLAGDRAEVGVTLVHEESVGREGDLAGYDARLRLDESTEVKGEFATTETQDLATGREGSAYMVEVNRKQKGLNARIFIQESDVDFGLGQQSVSERGLKKYGFDFSYQAGKTLLVGGRAYKQENLITEAERQLGEANMRLNSGSLTYIAGLRSVTDTFSDGRELASDQMTAGMEWKTLGSRLTLKLLRDQSISASNDNADYPTRTALGAEYRLSASSSLFAAQEYAQSDTMDYEATRAGIKTVPWEGASMNSSLERQFNENGTRVFSNFGLTQNWKLSDTWGLSAGLDSKDTLRNTQTSNVSNTVSATDDFTAVSMGATYSRKGFAWRNRIEFREAESYDKTGFFTAVNGEPREGLGLSAGLRAFHTEWANGAMSRDLSLRLGFVRRPLMTRWIILDRLDYIAEEEKGGQLDFDTWRLVNNLNVNYKVEEKYQVSVQYGSKYVKDSIDGLDYKGYTDLKGLELRYNITSKWDIGTRYSMLHSYGPGRYDYQSGLSVGYTYTRNVWLSMGYNFDGFRDRDFSVADYTAEGPFFRFKVKFDQLTAREAVRYFTGN